jgi:hypothetical protein
MPLPNPNTNESQGSWMARCMGHPMMKKEFPDHDQCVAVCVNKWQKKKKN